MSEIMNAAKELEILERNNEFFVKLSRICRCCLIERNDLKSLFDEQNSLISKMSLLTSMQISPNDGLPNNICEQCLELLINAVQFRQQILNADMSLRHYIAVALGYTERRELQILEFEQLPKTVSNNAAMNAETLGRNDQFDNVLSKENNQPVEHIFVHKSENTESVIISSSMEHELRGKSNEHDDNFEHQKSMKTEVTKEMNIDDYTLEDVHLEEETEQEIVLKDDMPSEEKIIQPVDYFFEPKTENFEPIIINSNMEKEFKVKSNKHDNNFEQGESIKIEIIEEVNDSDETSGKVYEEEETEPKIKNKKRKERSIPNTNNKFNLVNEKNESLKTVTNKVTRSYSDSYENRTWNSWEMLYNKNLEQNNESSEKSHVAEERGGKIDVENERPRRKTTINVDNNFSLINEENDSLISITDDDNSSSCSVCHNQPSSESCLECSRKKILNNDNLNNSFQYEEFYEPFNNESEYSILVPNNNIVVDDEQPQFNSNLGYSRKKKYISHQFYKRFSQHNNLVEHNRTHTEEKSYTCNIYDEKFPSSSNLKYHLKNRSEKKKNTCTLCSKRFTCHSALVIHIRTHTGEKPYVCNVCGKKMASSSNLKMHLRIHSDEKKFACTWCAKRFNCHSALVIHTRKHTGEKPYVCNFCGKKMTSSSNLKMHLRIHSDEQKFACGWCSKTYTQRNNLDIHIRKHTGEKPYSCNICDKKFASSPSLRYHLGICREKAYVQSAYSDVKNIHV